MAYFSGTYHQYDTVTYPKSAKVTKTWLEKAKATMAAISGFLRFGPSLRSSDELELKPLDSKEMGKLCLQVYLENYEKLLGSGNLPQKYDIPTLVEEIRHVYNSLLHRAVSQQFSGSVVERREGSLQEVRVLHAVHTSEFPHFCIYGSPHLPVTPAQLMRPGIGRDAFCAVGDFA